MISKVEIITAVCFVAIVTIHYLVLQSFEKIEKNPAQFTKKIMNQFKCSLSQNYFNYSN